MPILKWKIDNNVYKQNIVFRKRIYFVERICISIVLKKLLWRNSRAFLIKISRWPKFDQSLTKVCTWWRTWFFYYIPVYNVFSLSSNRATLHSKTSLDKSCRRNWSPNAKKNLTFITKQNAHIYVYTQSWERINPQKSSL